MTESEAQEWLRDSFGPAALARLERFVTLLLAEAEQQSLIARSTFASVWSRHIVDSAQLIRLGPDAGLWLDVGSGGGLPGIVVALLRPAPLVMVEPRRKRVAFLQAAIETVSISNARVFQGNAKQFGGNASVVSARAVASADQIFMWTAGNVSRETVYLLPRGENAVSDLAIARHAWHGAFHVEQSLTDPAAGIIIAQNVRRR